MPPSRRHLLAALGASLLAPQIARAVTEEDDDRWPAIRRVLFGERPISEDARGIIELDTPLRAADAAVVPIGIRTGLQQTPARYIQTVWLVIDRNPSPVGATFHFTPESGRAEIETRVRIEEYTDVRAIAELNDGTLLMHTRYVKASGGCSAPAGKDLAEALANLGKMKLRVEGRTVTGQPALAQLMISHPNVSGLAIDQLSRLAPKPHFVRRIDVRYAGHPVFTADVDFTISENPVLRFWFVPTGPGELRATVVDSEDQTFEAALAVQPQSAA